MAQHDVFVHFDASDPMKPIELKKEVPQQPGSFIDAERLYVRSLKPTEQGDADTIVYKPKPKDPEKPEETDFEFSIFFPNDEVINGQDDVPLTGGDVFQARKPSQEEPHSMNLQLKKGLPKKRFFEYYVTVQDPYTGQVYTDDPDVYIDC